MSEKRIRHQARSGRWSLVYRGVYATFTGALTRRAELWAVLLRVGPDAVLSHQTAAELYGLLDGVSATIHVTVRHDSNSQRCSNVPGVVIHRSRSAALAKHPVLTPPRTRVEETVLDLIESARDFEEAYNWICRAVGCRRTTAKRIRAALDTRPRVRWRHDIELALGYAKRGALSLLEFRYVTGVERAHGLPTARRQARVRQATANRYLDNFYPEYRACVEIDGTAAHPEDEQWRDKDRDRWNAVHARIETIRIGVPHLRDKQAQCKTAAEVAKWLSGRGPKVGRPCGEGCPLQ